MKGLYGLGLLVGQVVAGFAQVNEQFRNGANIVLNDGSQIACLSVMDNMKDLYLTSKPCGTTNPKQVWYYYDGSENLEVSNKFMKSFSDNGGAVEVFEASNNRDGENSGRFKFLAGGKIRNEQNQMCLGKGALVQGVQFLTFLHCSDPNAASWSLNAAALPKSGLSQSVQVVGGGPVVNSGPVVSSGPVVNSGPVVSTSPVVVQQQQQQQQGAVVVQTPQTTKQNIADQLAQSSGNPQESDHYLCICIISKDDDKCIEAVRAACTVGHIPQDMCRQSFEEGDHDQISRHIIDLIDRGAKCSKFDIEKLRADVAESNLPTHAFHGQQMVTAEDHYLCVCLSNGGDTTKLDKQCEDAVRIACLVGHIPEPDCWASFDQQNHGQIVEHIMRLIDSGANCQQKLQVHHTETCKNPPCYRTSRHSKNEPTADDHYLCACLEDHRSEICLEMVRKACKMGHIPAHDCEVAEKADYRHGVTRHVLHLIDHGNFCSVQGGELHFTNNRCHCKQEWTAKNGQVMKFPNNCGNPGQEKDFDWCETYAEEGCVGVGESMSWDRCDNPQKPRYHVGEFAQTSYGKVTPVSHYLCVCVDKNGNDEMCIAAVKAGCAVGHLPSDACEESFQGNTHAKISEHILTIIQNGARCFDMEIARSETVPSNYIASGCGHGIEQANGICACNIGYAGTRCDFCAEGYVSYPECVRKRDCSPACKYGTCDFTTGTCSCPPHRKGDLCDECASGYSGDDCSPSGLFSSSSLGFWLFLAIVSGGTYFVCCTPAGAKFMAKLPIGGNRPPGGAYSRLNNDDMDYFDDEDGVLELEANATAEDLAGTSFAPTPSSETLQPKAPHTGLAI